MSLTDIKNVDIDPAGRYKYILIRLKLNNEEKYVVRGHGWAEYHADILDDFESKLPNKSIKCECVGGGRILHEPEKKQVLVYGYSQGFGRADHQISVNLIKEAYPDYSSVIFSNDGY